MLRQFHSGNIRAGQRGFSMIELSIAMLIAVFLLGGLVTLVIGAKRTTGTQNAVSELQDNQRIAMTLITNIVQKAGYFPYPSPSPQSPAGQTINSFLAENPLAGVTLPAGQVLSGLYNAAAPGDSVAVRFFAPQTDPNNTIIDCAGQSNTSGSATFSYTNVFRVTTVNNVSWLQCETRSNNNGTLSAVLTVNLIPNVTQISVLYGVGSNAAGDDYSVVQYLNASQMTALSWLNVTAVKVSLTFEVPVYGTTGGQMSTTQTAVFTRVIPVMSRAGVDT
jgi:type IV pilus assembly protein PilW